MPEIDTSPSRLSRQPCARCLSFAGGCERQDERWMGGKRRMRRQRNDRRVLHYLIRIVHFHYVPTGVASWLPCGGGRMASGEREALARFTTYFWPSLSFCGSQRPCSSHLLLLASCPHHHPPPPLSPPFHRPPTATRSARFHFHTTCFFDGLATASRNQLHRTPSSGA